MVVIGIQRYAIQLYDASSFYISVAQQGFRLYANQIRVFADAVQSAIGRFVSLDERAMTRRFSPSYVKVKRSAATILAHAGVVKSTSSATVS